MEKQEKLCELQVSPSGVIAWGIEVTITEDGNEIAKSVNRTSICPDFEGDQSALPNLVQQAIAENWTPDSIAKYKEDCELAKEPVPESPDVSPEGETSGANEAVANPTATDLPEPSGEVTPPTEDTPAPASEE